jgi:hypothetical protein
MQLIRVAGSGTVTKEPVPELTYNPRFLLMSAQEFYRPGESVPETGVYSAIHDSHRPVHEVVLRKDDIFPVCAKCGEAVRFELVVENRLGSSSASNA